MLLDAGTRGQRWRQQTQEVAVSQHSSPPGFCDGGRGDDDDATGDDDDDNTDDDEEIERADSMPAVSH